MRALLFLGKSLLAAYIVTGILLFLLAMFLFHFYPNDFVCEIGILIIYSFACLLGGFLAGKQFRKKKWCYGLLVGFLYFLCVMVIGLFVDNGGAHLNVSAFRTLFMCLFAATIGGMLS